MKWVIEKIGNGLNIKRLKKKFVFFKKYSFIYFRGCWFHWIYKERIHTSFKGIMADFRDLLKILTRFLEDEIRIYFSHERFNGWFHWWVPQIYVSIELFYKLMVLPYNSPIEVKSALFKLKIFWINSLTLFEKLKDRI